MSPWIFSLQQEEELSHQKAEFVQCQERLRIAGTSGWLYFQSIDWLMDTISDWLIDWLIDRWIALDSYFSRTEAERLSVESALMEEIQGRQNTLGK